MIQFVIAQSNVEKVINGQVTTNGVSSVQGVNITNTSSKIVVVSDQYGRFSILAKTGDVLSFSDVSYEFLRKFISTKEFNLGSIIVDLTPRNIELDEVIINKHSDITAENLGIIPKDQIKLSPAERKVYTATEGTDALLNYFSGRTKMLKKEASIEKKAVLMVRLKNLFDDEYYTQTLKIAKDLIKGFQYYCIEDPYFVRSINDKNKTMTMFLIVGLASEFNKNQLTDEK